MNAKTPIEPPRSARVYSAIAAVMADLGVTGISKDRANQQQGYKFRGIDDVYNALSPILSRHNLCMLPRMLSREVVERQTAKGNALFYVTVEAEFDLISAEDGSKHTIRTYGEAMDSADKATNKAMSAAYKYAAMQAFAIPTEGDNDADATTHEVKSEPAETQAKTLSKAKARNLEQEMRDEMNACQTAEDLDLLVKSKPFQTELKKMPPDWQDGLREHYAELMAEMRKKQTGYVEPDFTKLEQA